MIVPQAKTLISATTTTGACAGFQVDLRRAVTFDIAGLTGSGSGAATVKIQGSNVATPGTNDWKDLSVTTLVLATTNAGDVAVIQSPVLWLRANVTAISGSSAAVTVIMSGG